MGSYERRLRVSADDPAADWTEPGVYAVDPGVYRIPLPLPNDGLRAVNVYAIEQGSSLTLIDSGWALAESRELLAKAVAALGRELRDVDRFLVTHVHRDHYTQAVELRREFGGKIALGIGEQPSLAAVQDTTGANPRSRQLARLSRCGAKPLADFLRVQPDPDGDLENWQDPDEWLRGTVDIPLASRTLRAIPTPGHTQGHVVFRDSEAGLLFAGDHVLPRITPSIGFEAIPTPNPLGDFLNSLRLVRELPDSRLLPAHGAVSPSVHKRVDELVDHHDARLAATRGTIDAGATTAYEASQILTWTRREKAYTELDPYNQMLAVFETQAHLSLLAVRGTLRVSLEDDVEYYAA